MEGIFYLGFDINGCVLVLWGVWFVYGRGGWSLLELRNGSMITVYAIHDIDAEKLSGVVSEMRLLGAPTIEVVDCGDHCMALEGSHRLAAAVQLGLTPDMIIHEQDDVLSISRFDWFDECNWAESEYTAGEVAGELFSPNQAVAYSFGT